MDGNDAGDGRLSDAESAFLREAGGFTITGTEPEAFERIVLRTAEREVANNLSPRQMAERLGIESGEVRPWSSANGLNAHRLGAKLMFPAWQLADGPDGHAVPLPHLRDVVWAMGGDLREVTWIMTTAQPELIIAGAMLTPAEWLAAGREATPVISILGEDYQW